MFDRRSDAFERALDEAASNDHDPDKVAPTRGLRVRGVAFGAAPGAGKARFGLALDWTDEPADRAAPPQPPLREAAVRSADTPSEISRGARPWRVADARPACGPLAGFRLAKSSRSAAGGRPQPGQRASGDRQHALRPSPAGACRRSAAAVGRLFG